MRILKICKMFCCFCFCFLREERGILLGLWDLSSLTGDWTQALAVETPSTNHWTTREFSKCSSSKWFSLCILENHRLLELKGIWEIIILNTSLPQALSPPPTSIIIYRQWNKTYLNKVTIYKFSHLGISKAVIPVFFFLTFCWKNFFFWHIVDLQCCGNFCCAAQGLWWWWWFSC